MNQTVVSYLSQLFSLEFSSVQAVLIYAAASLIFVGLVATIGGFGTYAERKISADMQLRIGPNRVGPYGLFQIIADALKMLCKENITPANADPFLYNLAPALCLLGVMATLAVLPFSSGLTLSHLNIGVVYLVGISSLVGLGVFLGGHASNSKWSMLGGMRGASQIISYEIPVTLSIITVVLLAGGLSFQTIVDGQSHGILSWYVFHNPFSLAAFIVFFIGSLAESNRAPFDLPEAESELVSGYHTEYTGMKFGFFALAEYAEVFVLCGVCASLFLGGYNEPFGLDQWIIKNTPYALLAQLVQIGVFLVKTCILYYCVIAIRWTLPRLRVDQLMSVCWKYLTPIAMVNIIGCAFWLYLFDGLSTYELLMKFLHSFSAPGGH